MSVTLFVYTLHAYLGQDKTGDYAVACVYCEEVKNTDSGSSLTINGKISHLASEWIHVYILDCRYVCLLD